MSNKRRGYAIVVLVVIILTSVYLLGSAQATTPSNKDTQRETAIEILCHMSGQLRLVRPLAAYAILSPIRSDQRLYSQYIINILEGSLGKDYVSLPVRADLVQMMKAWGISAGNPGLIAGIQQLKDVLNSIPHDSPFGRSQSRLIYAAENISFLLDRTLDEARASLRARSIDSASDHMRLAYAYAFAALGTVGEGVSPGSVTDILILLKGSPACRQQP